MSLITEAEQWNIQTVQQGLREIITGNLTIYFALIWQLCQQLLLVREKTRHFNVK